MRHRGALLTLFLIVFVDLLGVGIIIPILPGLFLNEGTMIVPADWSLELRNFILGLLIASYPIAQFFGAPVLGRYSDQVGRKKVLALSLLGTALGYLIFAYGLYSGHLWILFAGRILDGFTGGNIAVANSAIADLSPNKTERAQNFGLIGMAFGLGFVLGPFLGGVLGDGNLSPWFGPTVPFLFAAGLTFVNLIMLLKYLPETLKQSMVAKAITKISLWTGALNVIHAFRLPRLRSMFLIAFLHAFGFAFLVQFFPVYLLQKFGLSPSEIGLFFGYIGIWVALSQGLINRITLKYFKSEKILKVSFFLLAASLIALVIPNRLWVLFIIQPFVAAFEGITFPNITAVISELSTDEQQGESLGVTQSLRALADSFPPIIAGVLVSFSPSLPTLVSGVLMVITGLLYLGLYKQKHIL